MASWILIPARAGSKGVPGKNIRPLGERPLISYTLETASSVVGPEHTIVSTDDSAVSRMAEGLARVFPRTAELAGDKATLDEVSAAVADQLLAEGASPDDALLTVQPTSPFVSANSMQLALDAILSGGSAISVADDRGLRWTRDADGHPQPLFTQRVNRQWLPPTLHETGGLIGAKLGDIARTRTRVVEPIHLIELNDREGLDIDTFADWAVAEYLHRRKRIVVRADAAKTLGMGHAYRALALSYELAEHDIEIVTRCDSDHTLGAEFLAQRFSRTTCVESEGGFLTLLAERRPDVVILDVLDTTEEYVRSVQEHGALVVTLEDLGAGSHLADIAINDLYTDPYPGANHWYGVEYAILAPQFEHAAPRPSIRAEVESVLVTFGGTDPCHLTERALEALSLLGFDGEVTVVLGPGFDHPEPDLASLGLTGEVLRSVPNMADVMSEADLAITSAGRTVTELMVLGVPTIAMCQNQRELMHTHASSPFGVTNLGLGSHVEPSQLAEHIRVLAESAELRESMRTRMLNAVKNRANRAIAEKIITAADTTRSAE